MTNTTGITTAIETAPEIADLLETLATHRFFLTFTARELTDEQARLRPTVSELSIGGVIKHVAATERAWLAFVQGTPTMKNFADMTPADFAEHATGFQLLPDDTLAGVLADYEATAAATTAFLTSSPDLDLAYPLPEAPWFPPGATRSVRRVMLHVIAETAQHAGHADILRETIDGSTTMG